MGELIDKVPGFDGEGASSRKVVEQLGHSGLIDGIPDSIRGDLPKIEVREPSRGVVRTGARAALDSAGNVVSLGPDGQFLAVQVQSHNVTPELRDSILAKDMQQ